MPEVKVDPSEAELFGKCKMQSTRKFDRHPNAKEYWPILQKLQARTGLLANSELALLNGQLARNIQTLQSVLIQECTHNTTLQ